MQQSLMLREFWLEYLDFPVKQTGKRNKLDQKLFSLFSIFFSSEQKWTFKVHC